jgi:hypothetical protein
MSQIRVYLLAKTSVFRNEHFQLVFKLKTILLKIRALVSVTGGFQAHFFLCQNNIDYRQKNEK